MSLMPLGLLSQGGGANGGQVGLELISTTTLSAGATSVTFSSIASTYKHLQIRSVAKSTAGFNYLQMRFNNDSAANYGIHRLYRAGSTPVSTSSLSQTDIRLNMAISESGTTYAYSPMILDILDYTNTNKYKTIRAINGQKDWNIEVDVTSGLWLSTAAITSITLFTGTTNMEVGSRFSLYGVRG